jgi:hypothetical protein
MRMASRDLKLKACTAAFVGVDDHLTISTEELKKVAEAYDRNLKRVYYLIMFPPAAVSMAINIQRATDSVSHRLEGARKSAAIKEALTKHERKLKSASAETAKQLNDNMEKVTFMMLDELAMSTSEGHEAWMAAQITGSWTAFETMAGDLWETAINVNPQELAKRSGEKQIPMSMVLKYRFDLSKSMGSILKAKYPFDRLSGIRDAYKEVFGSEFADVLEDQRLDALSIVRNNFVHNGGVIDAEYLRRSNVLPKSAIGELGSPIPIDGELVCGLINPVLKLGNALIAGVDRWLVANQI